MIFATTLTYKRDWRAALPIVELGLRSTIHATTKISPYQVIFGRPMRTPLSWMQPSEVTRTTPRPTLHSEYVLDLQARLRDIHETLRRNQRPVERMEQNPQRQTRPLESGTCVMARILPVEKGITLPRYEGPYKIVGKLGVWTYVLQHIRTHQQITRNHHHVKVCSSKVGIQNMGSVQPHLSSMPTRQAIVVPTEGPRQRRPPESSMPTRHTIVAPTEGTRQQRLPASSMPTRQAIEAPTEGPRQRRPPARYGFEGKGKKV